MSKVFAKVICSRCGRACSPKEVAPFSRRNVICTRCLHSSSYGMLSVNDFVDEEDIIHFDGVTFIVEFKQEKVEVE